MSEAHDTPPGAPQSTDDPHRALDRHPRAARARLARLSDAEEFGVWFGVAPAGTTV